MLEPFNTHHVLLPKTRVVRLLLPKAARVLGIDTVSGPAPRQRLEETQLQSALVSILVPWDCNECPVMYFMYMASQKEMEYRSFHLVPSGTISDCVPLMFTDSFRVSPEGMLITFHVFEIPDNQKQPTSPSVSA